MYRRPLCIETDCANVASLLCSNAKKQSAIFPLIAYAKVLMSSFKEIPVNAVKRIRNKLSHKLAAYARILVIPTAWPMCQMHSEN